MMLLVKFQDNTFSITGHADEELTERTPMLQIVERILKECMDIRTRYRGVMSNDGRIIGAERHDILKEIDEFFMILCVFRERLLSGHKGNKRDAFDKKGRINFSGEGLQLICKGEIHENDLFELGGFDGWFEKNLLTTLRAVLVTYREAVADRVVSTEELVKITEALDSVLYQVLLMRYALESCVVDK